jgi:hypothetical protein
MRFLKHLGRLLREFFLFAVHHKAWWIIPIVIILLLMALVIVIGQSTAPFIYTLF